MTDNLPALSDLVLVAFIPNPRDMEIARVLGWYRIPLRSAPKVVAVDWLAFYQPASFGKEHKWQIEWVAPVRGHELLARMDLFKDQPDHPHAREEYFKIALGPLVPLPTPILAGKWKRLTFLYTTGEYLLQAEMVNDLTVRDDERTVLWQALRERALERQTYEVQDLPELPLDSETLAFLSLMAGGSPFPEE
ncbi:MAG TPA: hypothetical protein VJ965_05555 [Anaerolineales bacterium]|nr:hypothetical protein [Anaerolineales bacterium]